MCGKLLCLMRLASLLALVSSSAVAETLLDYDFSDGSGTTVSDLSGNGNDGTLVGFTDTTAGAGVFNASEGWVAGGGLCFLDGGARSYVQTPLPLNALPGDFTIEFEANYAGASGWTPAIGSDATGCCGQSIFFGIHSNQTNVEVRLQDSGGPEGNHPWTSVPDTTKHHIALVYTAATDGVEVFVDGVSIDTGTKSAANMAGVSTNFIIGNTGWSAGEQWDGVIFGVAISGEKLGPGSFAIPNRSVPGASAPAPADGAADVRPEVVLTWTPGELAVAHDVYFGTSADDVLAAERGNPLDVLARQGQSEAVFDLGLLPFGQTYYWRVDEVGADNTVVKGRVWSFTVEPYAYPLAGEQITATASSVFEPGMGPENTINGSGLDADDLHSAEDTDMWQSAMGGPQPPWIQYEFDRAYKMYEMWVWNYNVAFENWLGIGFKDVTIETSIDGVEWMTLRQQEFAQGPGEEGYAHNTTIDLEGVMARYIRLIANTHWGTTVPQSGLSEVRFFYIPGWAREPAPPDGATGIHPDVTLSWRAGREAATHEVYLSTNEQDVIDGTVAANTVTEASYDGDTLALGQTYHWRVDEVNEAEIPAVWPGEIWSFETAAYLVVDDFETYDDDWENFNRIFQVWIDGAGYTQPEPGHPGNGSGSLVGTSEAPWVELTLIRSGRQAMPISYNNTAAPFYSEVVRTFAVPQDWTKAGVTTLTLYFYGDPANSAGEKMYVKINGVEVPYDGDSSNLTHGIWQPWNIELASLVGVELQNVTEFIIGFSGSGSGVVTFDDIRLNPPTQIPDSQAPDDSALVAHWDFEGDFTDATGKGHDGLAFGDPTIVNDPLRGQVLVVDGDDRVGVSDAADLNFGADESLTLTAWANLDLVGAPEGWKAIVAKGRTELGGGTAYIPELYGFYVSPSNNWHVNAGGIGGDALPAAGGQWHHLAFVQDGPAGEGYFYIDGEVVVAGGADTCDTTGRPLFIGAAGTDVDVSVFEAFKGRIDDVRIYSYALSQLEIQYLTLE